MTPASITQASIGSTTHPRPGSDDALAQDSKFDAVLADVAQGGEPASSSDVAPPTRPAPTTSLGLPFTTNAIVAPAKGSASPSKAGGPDVHALLAKLSIGSDAEGTTAAAGLAATTSAPPAPKSAAAAKTPDEAKDGFPTDDSTTNVSTTAGVSTTEGTPATFVAMPIVLAAPTTSSAEDATAAPTSSRSRPAAAIGLSASGGTGAAMMDAIGSPSAAIVGEAGAPSPEAGSVEPDPLVSASSGAAPLAAAGAPFAARIDGSAKADMKVSVLGTARHLAPATQPARSATPDRQTNAQAPSPARLPTAGPSSSAIAIDAPPEAAAATAAAVTATARMASPNANGAREGVPSTAERGAKPVMAAAVIDPGAPPSAGLGSADIGAEVPKPFPVLPGAGVAPAATADAVSSARPIEDAQPDATLPTGTVQIIAGAVATLVDEAATTPAAPAPQAAPQPTPVAPARSLTLQLSPGALGAVTVHLHMTAGGLDVRLSVENDETRGAISRARDELAIAIGDTGTRLDSLTIKSADPSPALAGSNDSAPNDTPSGGGASTDNPGRRGSGGESSRRQENGPPPREVSAARDRGGNGVFV